MRVARLTRDRLYDAAMLYDYPTVTVDSVRSETDAAIEAADEHVARAVASAGSPTFDATLLPLELAGARLVEAYGRGGFMGQVHTDPAVRDAGNEAEERINKWRVAVVFRSDLYDAVRAFADTDEARALEGERARLLEHWLRDFRRAGHELGAEDRAELERLRTRLVEVEVAFQRNLNEYRDGIDVTREQLAGLPDAYIERLSPGERDGTYRVSLDYPEVNPFLEQAHDRELRRELFIKNWSKAVAANRPLLEEALDLRRRVAALLGHPTWAHHAMELKMARSPERVAELLRGAAAHRSPGRSAASSTRLGEALHADGHDGPITAWDWRYYDDALRRTEYGVDQNLISEYFPLERGPARHVRDQRRGARASRSEPSRTRAPGTSRCSCTRSATRRPRRVDRALLHRPSPARGQVRPCRRLPAGGGPSVRRRQLGHAGERHPRQLHAAVGRYAGAAEAQRGQDALPRVRPHPAHEPDPRRVRPLLAARRPSGTSSRLRPRSWSTGPGTHRSCSASRATTGPMRSIPAELVEQMVRARWVDEGIRIGVQAFYGAIDLALHAEPDAPDVDAALRRTYAVTGMPYPEGTFMLAGFGHLLGGYDAGYYGYLWAEVIGDDMFGRFAREGVLSPAVGADYRREILEPNGSRDADELVRAFLGREPSNAEFLRLRGMGYGRRPMTRPRVNGGAGG